MTIFAARNSRKNAGKGGAEKRAKKCNKLSHSSLPSTHGRAASPQTARAEEPGGAGKRKENVISTFLHSMKSGFTEINKSIICRRRRSPRHNDTATEARKESGGWRRSTPPQNAEQLPKARIKTRQGRKNAATGQGKQLPRSTNFPTARRGERGRAASRMAKRRGRPAKGNAAECARHAPNASKRGRAPHATARHGEEKEAKNDEDRQEKAF